MLSKYQGAALRTSDEFISHRRDHAVILATLRDMGAADVGHVFGSFEKHLTAVYDILGEWDASESLQLAGLFHAIYSTHGFPNPMVNISDRTRIVALIGEEAERDAYLFCACDRDRTWPQIGRVERVQFHDRFTRTDYELTDAELRNHCEILAANHVDFARSAPERPAQTIVNVLRLLDQISPFLSPAANTCYPVQVAARRL